MRKRISRVIRMNTLRFTEPLCLDSERDRPSEQPCHPYRMFESEGHLDVYLSSDIIEPPAYDDLCHALRQMGEDETVSMYINSSGGDMLGGMALIQAMRDCPATVTTVLAPIAMSVSALMFLSGDEFDVPTFGQLMLHQFAGGLEGKGHELLAELKSTLEWFEALLREICSGFLTDAEMDSMLRGQDIWLVGDDILQRVARLELAQAGLSTSD